MTDKAPTKTSTELAVRQRAPLARALAPREIEFQGLWFKLSRLRWRSLVVVPGDEGGSGAAVATALADVGRRLRTGPVTFLVMPGPLDFASAGRIVAAVAGSPDERSRDAALGRVIVAIPPVIVDPLGIAVTDAADAVLVCLERGRTRRSSARRTVDMIGRSRIVGSVLV